MFFVQSDEQPYDLGFTDDEIDGMTFLILISLQENCHRRKRNSSGTILCLNVSKLGDTMKTLIFNGSPRKEGDTVGLINMVIGNINGEYKIVNAYDCRIHPCVDCRYCWNSEGCSVDDEMQEVYEYLQDCDNVLIASPIYFSELTGALLNVASRLQTYFCANYFRKEKPIGKTKKGAVILVGGGDGNFKKAYDTACCLLGHMNAYDIMSAVISHDTNHRPALDDKAALSGVNHIVDFFNGN